MIERRNSVPANWAPNDFSAKKWLKEFTYKEIEEDKISPTISDLIIKTDDNDDCFVETMGKNRAHKRRYADENQEDNKSSEGKRTKMSENVENEKNIENNEVSEHFREKLVDITNTKPTIKVCIPIESIGEQLLAKVLRNKKGEDEESGKNIVDNFDNFNASPKVNNFSEEALERVDGKFLFLFILFH